MDNFEQAEKLWSEIVETMNKLSYIAAGTISLSITFLGYILSIGSSARSILNSPIAYKIPTVDILFVSWILLFLSVFLGIIIRIPNAWHLFNAHVNLWFSELEKKTTLGDEKNYRFVADSAKAGMNKYGAIRSYILWPTIIFFTIGIFMLIIFTIVVVNGLINIQK
jgi:hypothetical protein